MKATRKGASAKALQLRSVKGSVLHETRISQTSPGALLHDFNVVLDFIGAQGVPASGKYGLLPLEAVPALDQKLHRPLSLELERPLMRSHPYLMGLQLLLRASGLGQTKSNGSKTKLFLDSDAFSVWKGLNETEQYFALLESWLLNGDGEMIGERGQGWVTMLSACRERWNFLEVMEEREPDNRFFDLGDRYLYSLMDLFGFVRVQYPQKPVQPWAPALVIPTPFGHAAFVLIKKWHDDHIIRDAHSFIPGQWGSMFRPYFSDWQSNLRLPKQRTRIGTFVFKVHLGKSWRRIAIDASASLDELADAILKSVKFDSDHLYEFRYRDHFGRTIHVLHPEMDDGPFAPEVEVGSLPLEPGQEMLFRFDLGDEWHFKVILEKVELEGRNEKLPCVLEKHGDAPAQYPGGDY